MADQEEFSIFQQDLHQYMQNIDNQLIKIINKIETYCYDQSKNSVNDFNHCMSSIDKQTENYQNVFNYQVAVQQRNYQNCFNSENKSDCMNHVYGELSRIRYGYMKNMKELIQFQWL